MRLPCTLLLMVLLPPVAAQKPVDIHHLNCGKDRRVDGCLEAELHWTSSGATFTEPGKAASWGCSGALRIRCVRDARGTVWEYMTHYRPWPVRARVLDTLRIVRTDFGAFTVEHVRPRSDSLMGVAGTDRTTRPLKVHDTLTVDGGTVPGELAQGCMRRLRGRPITLLHLVTNDNGPIHAYVWSEETGLLRMVVPNAPRPADEMQLRGPGPGVPGLKEIKPSCPRKAALFAWLGDAARERWP